MKLDFCFFNIEKNDWMKNVIRVEWRSKKSIENMKWMEWKEGDLKIE